jgi:FkbM family methyltransferase
MITVSEHSFFEENLEDAVVVDMGACEGTFMKGILDRISVKKYIAVEANPVLYQELKGHESDKISIINAAAVENNYPHKNMLFHVDPTSIFNSSGYWKNKDWQEYEVRTIRLEDIFKDYQLEKIDLLKMDIEGAEWSILEEFDKAWYNKIDQITVEFHDFIKPEMRRRTKKLVKKMKALGYRHKYKGIEYLHNSVYYDSLFYKSGEKETIWKKIKNIFKRGEVYKINQS